MSTTDNDAAMEHDAAVKLDERIQRLAEAAGGHLDKLADLLAEAQGGQIHTTLGFPSWPAYLADRLKPITKTLDRDELCALVVQLYDAGMSVRAIAEAVDTSKSTVQRQVSEAHPQTDSQVSQSGTGDEAVETTGLDGKLYPRADTRQDTAIGDSQPELPTEQQDSTRHHGGGHIGPWTREDRLNRAEKLIQGITFEGEDAELARQICELIDQLLERSV